MKKCLLTILILYSWACSTAQTGHVSFRNININEGLSQSSVVDIAADAAGFIWLATQDGLNRYDGKEFVVFRKIFDDNTTITGSKLGKIVSGKNGEVWLITSGGKLEKFNLYNQSFTSLNSLDGDASVLPVVSCILPGKKNELWIGTESKGLFIYDQHTKQSQRITSLSSRGVLVSDNIEQLFSDKENRIWVLTDKGIVSIDSSKKISKITISSAETKSITPVACSSIDEDIRGNLWLGSYGKGLYYKGIRDTCFTPFSGFDKENAFPTDVVVQAIMADRSGMIWVGTYGKGLYIINPKDATIQHLLSNKADPFSLGYNDVLCIKQDLRGGIWVGTDGGGVSYYDKRLNNFVLFSNTLREDIFLDQIRSVTTGADGSIWAGTSSHGLTHIDPVKGTVVPYNFESTTRPISDHERIVSLHTDEDGDIWIGAQGNGLMIMDKKTEKIKKWFHPDADGNSSIPDHTIWCMLAEKNGQVWTGSRNAGLWLIDKSGGILKRYSNSEPAQFKMPENNIRTLMKISDSIICIGYEKKGVQFFNINSERFFVPDTMFNELGSGEITLKCAFYQQPVLWIGTLGNGLMAFDLSSKKKYIITESQGLPSNTIYGILKDKRGYLWFSSNRGISRFQPPRDLEKVNRSNFSVYTVEDGLQSNEFNTGAYYSTGELLFFGGIKGLNMFNPSNFPAMSRPIPVIITGATVNNEMLKTDTIISYKKILHLPYKSNSLSFTFSALDYASPGRFHYYYQLSDYDNNWIDAGNRDYAAYTNLAPGRYLFKVKASNQILTGGDDITTLEIIIDPPFWKTWWFLLLCILAFASLLYAIYRYRINQLIALQQVRNRIATDLHDDIGSTLTNISILSELSRKNLPEQEEARTFLNRISEEVYNSNQALDDIVWSINTKNDTLDQMLARMRRYAAEIFDAANITYTLQLDDQFADRKLNMEQRRDCFLIFKEAINNIYKHAHARHVDLRIWIERNRLYMNIKDDGNGFQTGTASQRNGIKNMRQRTEKWDGKINMESAPGKGTTIHISFHIA